MNNTVKQNIQKKLNEIYTYVQFKSELPTYLFAFTVGDTKESAELKVYNAEGFEVQMLGELNL